jgi:hypothetical protein
VCRSGAGLHHRSPSIHPSDLRALLAILDN